MNESLVLSLSVIFVNFFLKIDIFKILGDLAVEGSWEWVECGEEVADFEDLWFAVRGGGGGTFGIVTAVYYQVSARDSVCRRAQWNQ